MSGSNTAISRRRLLQGAGAMWLLSVSQVSLAAVSQVVAVRVWPASSYTRVTVESNRQLKYKQFALSNPERVVVDIEDVNLNSVLKGMAAQIRADDPFIKSARVGQFDPQTVRMVFELKQNVKPPRWRRLRCGGEIQNARKRCGIANSSPFALSDRERGQYEGVHDAQ